MTNDQIASVLADHMIHMPPRERADFLRRLIIYAAVALSVVDGYEATSEHLYRLADETVYRGSRSAANG